MLSVERAYSVILGRAKGRMAPILHKSLGSIGGHALAQDIVAESYVPAFDNSAVDGYAVCADDLTTAHEKHPIRLNVQFTSVAGSGVPSAIGPGLATRILTGAPVPEGATAIIMQEDVTLLDSKTIEIRESLEVGAHIRRRGADVAVGDVVVPTGMRCGPAEMAAAAACGLSQVAVRQKTRVAIITTGDEIVDPAESSTLLFGQIYNSNRYCLTQLVQDADAEVVLVIHCRDDFEATCDALKQAEESGADVIVCAGGVSVGDRDFVRTAIEKLGEMLLWKVAMKPGKPLAFGQIGTSLVFGLPGNPASVMVTFELFVRPTLLCISGHTKFERPTVQATLMDKIDHVPGRREYVRAHTSWHAGKFETVTTGTQGSGRIKSLLGANCLIVVSETTGDVVEGDIVDVILMQ